MTKCFVISPIGEVGSPIREHADTVFDFIIKPAMDTFAISTVRADHLHEPGKITDQMFREIASSDLCLAILTGHNPNVFYELALAQAARRPVVILIESREVIPFDVRDLRCVVYDLNPRSLFNKTFVDQLISHLQFIKDRKWCASSPLDAWSRQLGIEPADPHDIREDADGFVMAQGRLTLRISMGHIEHCETPDDCLTVLPANEFFDDNCINDGRSALGAYVQHHFPGRVYEVQTLVQSKLGNLPSVDVEKESGIFAASYGVGTCLYLDRPLHGRDRVAMVAVTTKRAGEGLRATSMSIRDAMFSIHRTLLDQRLNAFCVPTLGSGHGGLTPSFSLYCMLVSLAEIHKHPTGAHLKNVNIVVYRRDQSSEPSVSRACIRRALSIMSDLLGC